MREAGVRLKAESRQCLPCLTPGVYEVSAGTGRPGVSKL